jgi:phage host-nuclease inhibitor protein Gam
MVYRNDYECYEWWKLCGEFNITYPLYDIYYKNLDNMWLEIQKQNKDILTFCKNNKDRITRVLDNYHLADTISITREGIKTRHDYKAKGIEVYVYK